jgi:FAD/FMN-containing dehydrogenase
LLSSKYGLGADQALEWEVITANGTHLIASPTQHQDLYWALSGGGGGTYGVVLSLTVKAYPDGIVGGASMAISFSSTDDERMWETISFFQAEALPGIVDAGAHVQWGILGPTIFLSEVTIPDIGDEEMRKVMEPFTTYLAERNASFQLNVTEFPNYLEHTEHYFGPLPYGNIPVAQIQGGVLVSRETVKKNVTELTAILRHIITKTAFYVAPYSFNVGRTPLSRNAVLPAWRDALVMYAVIYNWNFTVPFSVNDEQERLLTEELMPPLQDLASGAYMNEANFRNSRWKEEFYGANWARLMQVKKRWDLEDLLYAWTGVGSDAWKVEENGRMCRV